MARGGGGGGVKIIFKVLKYVIELLLARDEQVGKTASKSDLRYCAPKFEIFQQRMRSDFDAVFFLLVHLEQSITHNNVETIKTILPPARPPPPPL